MILATLAVAGGRATATAHPQPSPDRNNRYLKLTPMADRLRLAYTVYLGEQPGAHARARLDRNHDGTVDDAEAKVIGDEVAAMVRPSVELTVDDRPAAIDWATVDVGLGTPATAAGALAVDLIGWVCTGDGAHHQLGLHDRVRIDAPGETELRLEEGPGVRFGDRRLAGEPMADLIATWRGDESRLTSGFEATYDVDRALAVRPNDRRCRGGAAKAHGRRPIVYAVAGLVGLALGVAAIVISRRDRKTA